MKIKSKRSDNNELRRLEIAKALDLSTISNLVFLIRLLICDPNFSFGFLYNPKVCGATFVKKKGFFFIPIYFVIYLRFIVKLSPLLVVSSRKGFHINLVFIFVFLFHYCAINFNRR